MLCHACRSTLGERDRFCAACGAPAQRTTCSHCGAANRSESVFCVDCGHPLQSTATAPAAGNEAVTAPSAELKFVTLLRADIVGSTGIIAELEPEKAVLRLAPALAAMRKSVRQFRGIVSKELGDGVIAAFGAPNADDNHSRLACHAALELVRQVADLGDPDLQVRVALHSAYLLAYIAPNELAPVYELAGSAQHLADRLQAAAAPGEILASEACRLLSEGYIRFEALPPRQLRGFASPVPVHKVLGVERLSTWQVRKARNAGRFVGRESEMQSLRKVADGIGRSGEMVSIVGDPGIGKSRLAHEFMEELRAAGWRVIEAECSPTLQGSPFALLKGVLQSVMSTAEAADRGDPRASLPPVWRAAVDAVLDLPVSEPEWTRLEPRQRGRAIADASRAIIEDITNDARVALLLEDLHWIDSASADPVESFESLIARHPLLILTTSRPTGKPELPSRRKGVSLWLRPLDDDAGSEMLTDILGTAPAVAELKSRILQHTGSVPLFVEEVCRDLSERGVIAGERGGALQRKPLDNLGVPTTVQGMIASRIDRLSIDERQLLRAAAAIGPRASTDVLQRITGLADEPLQSQLASLDRAELLIEVSLLPDQVYEFPHELVRQVTYEATLETARERLHAQILETFESSQFYAAQQDVLLHHALGAKAWSKAATFARDMARKCVERSALAAAATYFGIAMDAVERLPASVERERLAIDLRIESRVALTSFGVLDKWFDLIKEADRRAEAIGDHARKVVAMAVRAASLNFFGSPLEAIEVGEDVVARAEQLGDPGWLSYAEYGLGQANFVAGRCRAAGELFARAGKQLNAPGGKAPLGNTPQGLSTLCHMMWAASLGMMGDWNTADAVQREAAELAERSGRPVDRVAVGYSAGSILVSRGDFQSARAVLEATLKLACEHETNLYVPIVTLFLGITHLELGAFTEAQAVLTDAIENAERLGHSSVMLRAPAYLAIAQAARGECESALATVRNVRARALQQGYQGLEAETWLCEARILSMSERPDATAVSAAAQQCIAIARPLELSPLATRAGGMLTRHLHGPT